MEEKTVKNKKKKWPFVVAAIVVLMIISVAAGSGNKDDNPKKVDNGSASVDNSDTNKSDQNKFGVGETAELKGVQVTLVNVTESTGSAFFKPADGKIFVLCEFEIANNSKNEINVSSMISFDAYCDDYSMNQNLSATTSGTQDGKSQLDGSVASGKKMSGVIGYEVSADWKKIEISYSPSFWGKAMKFEAIK